ncbi:MAG TPA: hypothetical protein VNA19_04095 [Pyrinomonadaceae bacterium]|jgi:signal transduction histidine kinase|nr:hypothetical protein [Pyrinomonadaceae bacterium]
MKPIISETQDAEALKELGRASVQIVHDLKNQINGLKLYATFLRKRLERAGRPADELETLGKLIAGLERAAADTSALVRFGRPLELRREARADLAQILNASTAGEPVEAEGGTYVGEFDAAALTEAFQQIHAALRPTGVAAHAEAATQAGAFKLRLRHEGDADAPSALVEWSDFKHGDTDLFRSFAGGTGLRMALAAKIIRAHGGDAAHEADALRVRLPLTKG